MNDLKEEYEERAAIMQYCGGLSRTRAEKLAREIVYGTPLESAAQPFVDSPAANNALSAIKQILNGQ